MIQWKCISCGATIKGPDNLEGKEVKCPKCKERIRLKAGGETEKSSAKEDKKPQPTETKEAVEATAKEKTEQKKEGPAKAKEPAGPMPGPAPAEEGLPSAKDLLSEAKAKSGPVAAEREKAKPSVESKKPSPPFRPIPAERGLPINLIIGLIGVVAIAITAYVIYQKNQEGKEKEHTQKVVKGLREELDKIRAAVTKGEDLANGAEYAKAEEMLKGVKPAIKRLLSNVELELGAAVTEFSKDHRSRLTEDAEAADGKADDLLANIEKAGAETKKMAAFVAEREKELAEVEAILEKAKKQMADADYVSAQRTLRKAKSDAEDVVDEIEFEERDITRPELKKIIAECKTKAQTRMEAIENLLKSEDIINGSRGLVKYQGKWMTPEQKAEAEQPKQPAAAAAAAQPKAPVAFKPDDMEWLIDDMSEPMKWARQTWADPAELQIVDINADKMLIVRYQRGAENKVAIGRGMKLDVSSRGMLVVDVENQTTQPVQLCLALVTDQFYESQGQQLQPGMNKGISFSLSDASYKCAKDGWLNYNHQVGSLNSLGQVLFMIYPPGTVKDGAMLFDNVRMVAK
ncbi:MAG: hypothetical protein AB1696_11085 [Planctomycetota bacterium]